MRKSLNPSKQFMFFFLYKDMAKSQGKSVGLDLAAGDLANYKYFKSSEYIAVEKYMNPNLPYIFPINFSNFRFIKEDILCYIKKMILLF
jgi:hypothetical protein